MPSKDQSKNRAAVKRHYDSHPEYYREKNRKARQRKSDFIRSLREAPCVDCTESYPWYVMQFDHRDGKEYNIAQMTSQSWKRIHAEIAKCDVVCANCHCVRTHQRRITVL